MSLDGQHVSTLDTADPHRLAGASPAGGDQGWEGRPRYGPYGLQALREGSSVSGSGSIPPEGESGARMDRPLDGGARQEEAVEGSGPSGTGRAAAVLPRQLSRTQQQGLVKQGSVGSCSNSMRVTKRQSSQLREEQILSSKGAVPVSPGRGMPARTSLVVEEEPPAEGVASAPPEARQQPQCCAVQ